jgi:hypothetical protein
VSNTELGESIQFALKCASAEDRKAVEEYYEREREYARTVFWSLALCLRIPDVDRRNMDSFHRWETNRDAMQTNINTIRASIENLQRNPAAPLDTQLIEFALQNFWPFVLVLALSFKFAKGVAGLRPSSGSA